MAMRVGRTQGTAGLEEPRWLVPGGDGSDPMPSSSELLSPGLAGSWGCGGGAQHLRQTLQIQACPAYVPGCHLPASQG